MSFTSIVNSITGGTTKSSKDSLSKSLANVYSVDWAYPSLFRIQSMQLNNSVSSTNTNHFLDGSSLLDLINASVLNVETATVNNTPIEEFIGGQWVYTNGRPELRHVTFTFRETSNAWLYRNFNTAYNANKNAFPDNQKWTLNVYIYGPETPNSIERFTSKTDDSHKHMGTLIDTKHAIIESISSINLDQGNVDGFVTFSVIFKYINNNHNIVNLIKESVSATTGQVNNPNKSSTKSIIK